MNKIAIITARGGSKRIPRKNIKDFMGKPILAYSIEAALKSGLFHTVMVSTDDEEIAGIAKKYGAQVPFFRSKATSGDHATTTDVIMEVLSEYEKRNIFFDVACCMYPTAPFVTAAKLQKAMEAFLESEADTLIPVVSFSYPPQRDLVIRDGKLFFEHPEFLNTRSQDLETCYHDVGQFYLLRTKKFQENKNLMNGNIIPFIIPETEVQDIDNLTDWEIAELKYRYMLEKGQQDS